MLRSLLSALLLGAWLGCDAVVLAADEPTAIFAMQVDGSQVRRLADVAGATALGSPRWSHDARQLAFGAGDEPSAQARVMIVEAKAGRPRSLGLGTAPDWSPDDKQLVFSVLDETTGKQTLWVQNADGRGRLSLGENGTSPRWSPVGGALAILDGDALAVVDLIESTRRRLEVPEGGMPGFDWSPDGGQIALVRQAGNERELWLVNVADGTKQQKLLTGNLDGTVAWSPDGKRLAVSIAGQLHLVSTDGSGAPRLIPDQQGTNRMPAWSSDGKSIAFVSTRTTPTLAPLASKTRSVRIEEVRRHARGAVVYGLDLSLDGRKALLGGKRDLELWDLNSDETSLVPLRGEWVAMSPDGHTVALCGPIVKVTLGEFETGKPIRDLHVGTMCTNVRFSPDGKRVACGTIDKQAMVYDVASGKRVSTFNDHQAPITRVAFLPGSQEVVSNGQDQQTRIWNAETGQQRLALSHGDVPWALAVSPDGRYIATGTGGATFDNPILHKMKPGKEHLVRLWDTASGQLVHEMPGHTDVVYTMVFSPDGRTLVTGGWDATIRVWDVATGQQLASVVGQGSIYGLAITPDGSQIVAGGGENRSAGAPLRRFRDEQVRLFRIVEE